MTEEIYIKVQERLDGMKAAGILAYVAEDWGQLDLYEHRPPVNWPCCLFEVTSADYSDAGRGRQDGTGEITIRIADYNPVAVSSGSPDNGSAFGMINTVTEVYRGLQGMSGETFTRLTRARLRKAKRDDGIREFEMVFAYSFVDVSSVKTPVYVNAELTVEKKEA